jgi:hypothetical protein
MRFLNACIRNVYKFLFCITIASLGTFTWPWERKFLNQFFSLLGPELKLITAVIYGFRNKLESLSLASLSSVA